MNVSEQWRLLDTGACDPAYNMALDEAVLTAVRNNVSPPTVRFYAWKQPAVTLGYRQNYFRDIRQESIEIDRVPVIRRITGGLAVYHWREITYSVVYRYHPAHDLKTANRWFRLISAGLIEGLKELGIEGKLMTPTVRKQSPEPSDHKTESGNETLCFALPRGVDITVNGKKLIGSAQRRFKNAFLQQGSILIERNPEKELRYVTSRGGSEYQQLHDKMIYSVTSISEETERCPAFNELVDMFSRGIAKIVGIQPVIGDISDCERRWSSELVRNTYETSNWNIYGVRYVRSDCLK